MTPCRSWQPCLLPFSVPLLRERWVLIKVPGRVESATYLPRTRPPPRHGYLRSQRAVMAFLTAVARPQAYLPRPAANELTQRHRRQGLGLSNVGVSDVDSSGGERRGNTGHVSEEGNGGRPSGWRHVSRACRIAGCSLTRCWWANFRRRRKRIQSPVSRSSRSRGPLR